MLVSASAAIMGVLQPNVASLGFAGEKLSTALFARQLEENQYVVKKKTKKQKHANGLSKVMIKMHVTQDFDIRLPYKVAERKSQGFLASCASCELRAVNESVISSSTAKGLCDITCQHIENYRLLNLHPSPISYPSPRNGVTFHSEIIHVI